MLSLPSLLWFAKIPSLLTRMPQSLKVNAWTVFQDLKSGGFEEVAVVERLKIRAASHFDISISISRHTQKQ